MNYNVIAKFNASSKKVEVTRIRKDSKQTQYMTREGWKKTAPKADDPTWQWDVEEIASLVNQLARL